MLENKLTNQRTHYSRYIASWRNAGWTGFGDKFKIWLESEGCTPEEIHDIVDMAIMGKLELEKSARLLHRNS